MNNFKDGLHLSVDHAGRVSLWDTQHAALRGKADGDSTVHLVLTPGQREVLNRAMHAANPPGGRRPDRE